MASYHPPPPITIERSDPRLISDLANEQGKNAQLTHQVMVLQAQIQTLSSQYSSSVTEVDDLKRVIQRNRDLSVAQEHSQLQHLESSWSDKCEALERRLDAAQGQIARLEGELNDKHVNAQRGLSDIAGLSSLS